MCISMKFIAIVLIFLSMLFLIACGTVPEKTNIEQSFSSKPILVKGEILSYKKASYWSHYDDGSYDVADSLEFKILEPLKHKGKRISVNIAPLLVKDEFKIISRQFNFEIDENIFADESKSNTSTIYFFDSANLPRDVNESNP